jgi:PelA/Pel-15E family pectate lyase
MKSPIQAFDSGTLVTRCRRRVGTFAALALFASVALGCGDSNSDTGGPVLPSTPGAGVNTPPPAPTSVDPSPGATTPPPATGELGGSSEGIGNVPIAMPPPAVATPSAPGSPPPIVDNLLPQEANPVYDGVRDYVELLTGTLEGDKLIADAIVAYQLPVGGWVKGEVVYADGVPTAEQVQAYHAAARGLGSIDNSSTITEFMFLADVYKRSAEPRYQASLHKAMAYFRDMQGATGGLPQFYPDRAPDSYSNHATFNDNAMIRVLTALEMAERKLPPFDSDLFSPEQMTTISEVVQKGVDYILAAQIVVDGARTVWCAQHTMDTYEPVIARSYELPSKSGSESVGVLGFLMSRPQTPEIVEAIQGALAWFRSPDTYLADHTYDRAAGTGAGISPIVPRAGSRMWYRFYELDTNEPMFVNRDGTVFRDILQMDVERKDGYRWGGDFPEDTLAYAESVGY